MGNDYNIKNINRKYSKNIDLRNLNRDISWKIKSAEKHKELAMRYTHTKDVMICPVCNEKRFEKFVTIYGYDYVECQNCGHIYLQDLIDSKSIEKLYLGDEEKNLQHMVYLSEELFVKRVRQISKPKVEWVLDNTYDKGIWIDIGCGTGEILFAAKEAGYIVKGIDADKQQIKFAEEKGISAYCDYLNEDNAHKYLKDGEIVSLFNVLEHLQNPKQFLATISDNINMGTYVVIEVPRHPSISSLSNLIFSDIACRHIYPPDHMHIFTEKSLELMLNQAGLKPKHIWNFGQDAYDFIMTALASKNISKSNFVDNIISIIPNIQRAVDECGFSDTMIIICQKQSS